MFTLRCRKSYFLSIPSEDIKKQFSTSNLSILASSYKAFDLFMFDFLLLSACLASNFVKDILKKLQVKYRDEHDAKKIWINICNYICSQFLH